MAKATHDWTTLDPHIDHLKAQGWNDTQIAKDLGIGRQTLVDHLRRRDPSTPPAHVGPPEHQGTLEGYQEVMEDVQQSVPEAPHISTEEPYQSPLEHQSVPQPLDIPEEAHPSTPKVHHNMSEGDSGVLSEYSSVPARQDHLISTPIVHPSTPTAEDWQLWAAMKTRWGEVEKMLADWQTRHSLLSTPMGTPRQTQKKTYVFDVQHIALIDEYARVHRLELKDVIYTMCQEFFERRANS
jgi:hypothetical protein